MVTIDSVTSVHLMYSIHIQTFATTAFSVFYFVFRPRLFSSVVESADLMTRLKYTVMDSGRIHVDLKVFRA